MHRTSDLYTEIYQNPLHRKETRVDIAGVTYSGGDIVSNTVYGGIFSAPGIGICAARQIALTVFPKGDIPRQAKIEVFVRLTLDDKASEWLPKGVFFIRTRQKDKRTGALTISGADAMLKAEAVWLNDDYKYDEWPKTQDEAVRDIAQRMGVEVDSRTVLSPQFPVDYPIDENGDLTMRQVLSFIAVSNAGNWVITDEGKLRLLAFGVLPPETNYLVTEYGEAITLAGVRILV